MKILVLLFALLVAFCFACKDTLNQRELVAERQQLLAATQEAPMQPQLLTIV